MENKINLKLNFNEPEELILDAKHPGFNDAKYIARRKMFFDISRKYRLQNIGLPKIDYLEEEEKIWRYVMHKLKDAHERKACSLYLCGKKALQIDENKIPHLDELDKKLRRHHNIGLVAAEGLIDVGNFFQYLSNRLMPVTQFLRHGAEPEYTPEPDVVHDVIGHVPPLMNEEYTDIIQLIGLAVQNADQKTLQIWQRIYWFTIEFGLIEEKDDIKVFGSGLLSSFGEMEYCFSDAVDRRVFDMEEIISTDYDSSVMQNILFVIPSLTVLKTEIKRFMLSEKYL